MRGLLLLAILLGLAVVAFAVPKSRFTRDINEHKLEEVRVCARICVRGRVCARGGLCA